MSEHHHSQPVKAPRDLSATAQALLPELARCIRDNVGDVEASAALQELHDRGCVVGQFMTGGDNRTQYALEAITATGYAAMRADAHRREEEECAEAAEQGALGSASSVRSPIRSRTPDERQARQVADEQECSQAAEESAG